MTTTVSQDKTIVWLDNKPVLTIGREGNSDITVNGSALYDAVQAELFGKDIDDETGVIVDSGDFVEKYFAFAAEVGNYGGAPSLVWFLKTSFSIPDARSTFIGCDCNPINSSIPSVLFINRRELITIAIPDESINETS
jgi:hypothetical protein